MNRIILDIQRFAGPTNIVFPNNGNMEGYIRWESTVVGSTTQEKATNNKSNVTAYLYVRRNDGYSTWGDFSAGITINGTSQNFYPVWLTVSGDWVFVASKTVTVSHNADGSKSITISGWVTGPTETTWEGKTVSGSGTAVLDKIARYATSNQSLNSKTETSIKMNWSSDNTCDYLWYSTNNGSSWTAVGSINATSGNYTISGLTANTTYNIKTRVRRKDSQLTTDSSNLPVKTYNYPICTSTNTNFTVGQPVTLTFDNPLNRTFAIRMWSHVSQGFVSDSINISGTSYTFTPDATTLYNSIPNASESNYNIDSTYSGHKLVQTAGKYSVDRTACEPDFEDFGFADGDDTTFALTNDRSIIVQGYSDVVVTIPIVNRAFAKNGASMSYYNVVIGEATPVRIDFSESSTVNGRVNNVPSNVIKVYAVDSRGISKLVQKSGTLKDYTNIQRGNINVERTGNVGESVTLTFNGTFWNQNFGSVTNTIKTVTYRFKKTNEDDTHWVNGTTSIQPSVVTSNNDYSFEGAIAGDDGNNGFTANNSFNIEVTVSDELSSTTFTFVLGTGIPWIAVADEGIAIKQPYDTNDDSVLQVNGKTHLKGNTTITGSISTSSGATIGGNTSVTGNITATQLNGYQFDFNTNNTSDTWVPVLNGNKLQHRVIPSTINENLLQLSVMYNTDGTSGISDNQTKTYQLERGGFYLFIDSHPYNNSIGIINGHTGAVKYIIETSGHLVFTYNTSTYKMTIRAVNGARFKLYLIRGQGNV